MAEGDGKKQKPATQQAQVQPDRLGFYPLNSLAASALAHGQADVLIGATEDALASRLRQQTEWQVGNQALTVEGKIAVGISDAFYRGKLPELLIVTAGMSELPQFIESFLDYLEKLCSLGFLTETETDDELAVLDLYVPLIIIATYGIVYDAVTQKIKKAIGNLPTLSPRQRERLILKLMRATFSVPAPGYDLQLYSPVLFPAPLALTLSGTKSRYTVRAVQLLEQHQIPYVFNPHGVVELELNLGYHHLARRVLPGLPAASGAANDLLAPDALSTHMEQLGQALGLLPGMATATDTTHAGLSATESPSSLSMADVAITRQLEAWAISLSLDAASDYFSRLSHLLQQALSAHAKA